MINFLPILSTKSFLWLVFMATFFLLLVVSSVLIYHWRQYGMKSKTIVLAETVYVIISTSLAIFALFSLISY